MCNTYASVLGQEEKTCLNVRSSLTSRNEEKLCDFLLLVVEIAIKPHDPSKDARRRRMAEQRNRGIGSVGGF